MHRQISDLRIRATKPLVAPSVLEKELPLEAAGAELVARSRRELGAIFAGTDDRLAVVVGPCSIHDAEAALDYAVRLGGGGAQARRKSRDRDAGLF